jgi:hypothetical protein
VRNENVEQYLEAECRRIALDRYLDGVEGEKCDMERTPLEDLKDHSGRYSLRHQHRRR